MRKKGALYDAHFFGHVESLSCKRKHPITLPNAEQNSECRDMHVRSAGKIECIGSTDVLGHQNPEEWSPGDVCTRLKVGSAESIVCTSGDYNKNICQDNPNYDRCVCVDAVFGERDNLEQVKNVECNGGETCMGGRIYANDITCTGASTHSVYGACTSYKVHGKGFSWGTILMATKVQCLGPQTCLKVPNLSQTLNS